MDTYLFDKFILIVVTFITLFIKRGIVLLLFIIQFTQFSAITNIVRKTTTVLHALHVTFKLPADWLALDNTRPKSVVTENVFIHCCWKSFSATAGVRKHLWQGGQWKTNCNHYLNDTFFNKVIHLLPKDKVMSWNNLLSGHAVSHSVYKLFYTNIHNSLKTWMFGTLVHILASMK